MPWVLNAVWKLIKQLLTEEQQKFVMFAKKNDVDKYIGRDQLLVHMGGTVSQAIIFFISFRYDLYPRSKVYYIFVNFIFSPPPQIYNDRGKLGP